MCVFPVIPWRKYDSHRPVFGEDFLGQILAADSLPGAFVRSRISAVRTYGALTGRLTGLLTAQVTGRAYGAAYGALTERVTGRLRVGLQLGFEESSGLPQRMFSCQFALRAQSVCDHVVLVLWEVEVFLRVLRSKTVARKILCTQGVQKP